MLSAGLNPALEGENRLRARSDVRKPGVGEARSLNSDAAPVGAADPAAPMVRRIRGLDGDDELRSHPWCGNHQLDVILPVVAFVPDLVGRALGNVDEVAGGRGERLGPELHLRL